MYLISRLCVCVCGVWGGVGRLTPSLLGQGLRSGEFGGKMPKAWSRTLQSGWGAGLRTGCHGAASPGSLAESGAPHVTFADAFGTSPPVRMGGRSMSSRRPAAGAAPPSASASTKSLERTLESGWAPADERRAVS